jgi:hypothetical protein
VEHEWDAGERSSACYQREIAALTEQVEELKGYLRQIADGRSGNNVFYDMEVLQRVARAGLRKYGEPVSDGE